MAQDCYGKEFGKEKECTGCKSSIYCKEAVYVDPEQKIPGQKRTKRLSMQGIDTIYAEDILKQETSTLSGLFSEILYYLQNDEKSVYKIFYFTEKLKEIFNANPKTLKIALLKIVHPSKSFSSLGQEINGDKQLVDYHLRKARQIFPEIDKAFIIDKRKYPIAKRRKRKVLAIVKGA